MKKNAFILVVICLCSCSKILEQQPKGQIPLSDLFVNEESVKTAVMGAYQPLQPLHNGVTNYFNIVSCADDDGWTWNPNEQPDLFTLDPNDTRISFTWSTFYSGITRCNAVIANASKAKYATSTMEDVLIGQAYFLRAYYYFHLVRLFGKVPLILEEIITRADAELPRAEIKDVYQSIKNDLTQAVALLPANYNNGAGTLAPGLATKYAAIGLAALVNLELEEWQDAVTNANQVLASGQFKLLENYADNFNGKAENGSESLFEVQFNASPNTSSALSAHLAPFIYNGGSSSARNPLPTDANYANYPGYKDLGRTGALGGGIIQDFEPDDLRFKVAVSTYGIANFLDNTQPAGSLYYVHKYLNIADPIFQSSYNFPLIRLAEIHLLRAEALNELEPNDNTAISDIETIRHRAGLGSLDAAIYTDQVKFREAIRKERRTELCFENKRYFDLNRWGILQSKLAVQKVIVQSSRMISHPVTNKQFFLYPIPGPELINNPSLQGDQNPGY